MRYALLTLPLAPLALAAVLAGGHVADSVTDAVRDMPAAAWPGTRPYRLTAITDSGDVASSTVVRAIDEPRIHVDQDGRWSVNVLGVMPLVEPTPPGWVWIIQPVTE